MNKINQSIISGVVKNVISHSMNNPMQEKHSYVFVDVNPNDCIGNIYDIDMSSCNCIGLPNEDWEWGAEFVRLSCIENGKVEICFLIQHGNRTFHASPEINDEVEIMVD